jgi:2-dehydro-3-deoxyphosphogluconate aldolase/(4S)-4-hydroxy-2-oxoglutarate aldolase
MSLAPGAAVAAEHPLLAEIVARRAFAVLRTERPEQAIEVGRACLRGGIRFLEVRLTLPDALSVVRELAREPQAVVGVGMVVQPVEVRDAAGAGARFSVSPHFDSDILAESKSSGLLSLMGGVTATEVMACHRAGVDVTKIFPAVTFGPAYLKALREPLPFLRLMPTGGVDASNLKAWLDAGAVGVALGRSLADLKTVGAQDWSIIEGRARRVVEAVALWSAAGRAAGAP